MGSKYIPIEKARLVASNPIKASIVISLSDGPLNYEKLYESVTDKIRGDNNWWYRVSSKTYSEHVNDLVESGVIKFDGELYSIKNMGDWLFDILNPRQYLSSLYRAFRKIKTKFIIQLLKL